MSHYRLNFLLLLLLPGLSQAIACSQTLSLPSQIVDSTISCIHWITCPYCLFDSTRQTTKFQQAIDQNDVNTITHIIRRRDLGANRLLPEGELPLIRAARKAHIESIEKLLQLGADANSQLKGSTQAESYPSALIAVCMTDNLDPEKVASVVKILLDHGADPKRHVTMLTETEKAEFAKIYKEAQENPAKERQVLARISEWYMNRTALNFAVKHNYTQAANIIRQALTSKPKQGLQKNESDERQSDDYM